MAIGWADVSDSTKAVCLYKCRTSQLKVQMRRQISQFKRLLARQRKKLKEEPNFSISFKIKLIAAGFDQATLFINGLIFLPFYLSYIGAEMYGYWLATGGILVWMGIFNFATITSQRVASAYGCKDYKRCACYYWTGLKIYGVLAIGVTLIGWRVSLMLPSIFDIPEPLDLQIVQGFQIAVLAVMFQFFGACAVSFVSSIERPGVLLFTSPAALVLQIIVVFYGLLNEWGILAIAVGLFAQAIFKTFATVLMASWYARALAGKAYSSSTVFMDYMDNFPSSCLRAIGSGVSFKMQPTLITLILGPNIATAYDITSKSVVLIQSVMGRVMISAFSGLSNLLSRENKVHAWNQIRKGFSIFQLCAFGAVIGYLIFNRSFVSLWVGGEYFLGNSITLAIGVGTLVAMCVAFLNLILMGSGDLKKGGYLTFVRTITAIGFAYLGINWIGIIGLPLALVVNEFFYLFIYKRHLSNLGCHLIQVRANDTYIWVGAIGVIAMSQYLSNLVYLQTWFRFTIWTITFVLLFFLLSAFLGRTKLSSSKKYRIMCKK